MTSVVLASLKLEKCFEKEGARVLQRFDEAFETVLREKDFCRSSLSLEQCIHINGYPLKPVVFEVNAEVPQENDCSISSMQKWISFSLMNN